MAKRFKDDQLNLDILAEEALEVAKVVSKIRRFGLDDFHPANGKPNRAMLAEEIGHFMFMVATLHAGRVITEEEVQTGMTDKSEKLPAWYRGWMEQPEHECCGDCTCAEPKPLSKRGQNWQKFSESVGLWLGSDTPTAIKPITHLIRARSAAEAGDFNAAAGEIFLATLEGSDWTTWPEFSDAVLNHIETYTVPQYGDVGDDRASKYTVAECLEHLSRYYDRFGRNSREGQQELDFLKMAHYISLASEAAAVELTPSAEGLPDACYNAECLDHPGASNRCDILVAPCRERHLTPPTAAEKQPCEGVGCVHMTSEGCGQDGDCLIGASPVNQPCSNANCRSRREGQCGWLPKDYESCTRRDSLIATPGPNPLPVDPEKAKAAARDHSNGLLPVKPLKDEYPCFNSDCVVSWKPDNTCADGFGHKVCAGRIDSDPGKAKAAARDHSNGLLSIEPRPVCTTDCNSNSGDICMADRLCEGHSQAPRPLPVGMTPLCYHVVCNHHDGIDCAKGRAYVDRCNTRFLEPSMLADE